ncbi:hypothetical protein GCM10010182_19090 [Actinomadura cremea]|nr:hypothetical protein GCM10010182_19090 [Actinomadura cremea]
MRPAARLDRWRRSCGFDRNDLRRYVDRAQWRFGLFLLALFLAAAPPLCAHVVGAVDDSGRRAERHGAATWKRVDATVVRVEEAGGRYRVTVAWTGPDGTRRTGECATWRRTAARDSLVVWAGAGGAVSTTPPRTREETVIYAVGAGIGVVLATGLPLLALYLWARHRYDRIRYRSWAAAWDRLDNHRIGP